MKKTIKEERWNEKKIEYIEVGTCVAHERLESDPFEVERVGVLRT